MFWDSITVFVREGVLEISDNKYCYLLVSRVSTHHRYGKDYLYRDVQFTTLKLPTNLVPSGT